MPRKPVAAWAVPTERQVERALTRREKFRQSSLSNSKTGRDRLAVLDMVLEREGLAGADPRLAAVWELVRQEAKEQLRQLLVTQAVMMALGEAEGDSRAMTFLLCNWWSQEFKDTRKLDISGQLTEHKILTVEIVDSGDGRAFKERVPIGPVQT